MDKPLFHVLLSLLMCLTLPLAAAAQVVDIPDPNLRAAIETALGKALGAPITVDEIARLTHLEARNANISDLTGLEHATNLTSLFLSAEIVGNEWQNSNAVSDLSPLSGLANLTRLTINFDAITDISPLAGLTSLTGLFLWDNNITDISAVAGLTNLTELSLGSNNITDISPLSGLTNLTGLWLNGNNIWDISPLVANTGLGSGDTVNVQYNPLSYQSIHTHIPTLQSRGVTVDLKTKHLNTGEPRTVRMIYFLPNDRPYRADLVQEMKDGIRNVQTFYAEQMGAHGYGNKTFRVETDSQGEPMVHRVAGQYPDNHYFYYTESTAWAELELVFNRYTNIYLVVVDTINTTGGSGGRQGKNGGGAALYGEFRLGTAAHELGHAFGLWHDFRDGTYLMSYGPGSKHQLSACHAEYLSVHPYFNPDTPIEGGQPPPTIELISSRTYPADSKSIPVRLKVSDSDGLHQVLLHLGPPNIRNSSTVKACRGLGGKKEAVVEFDYDGVIPSAHEPSYSINTSLLNPLVHPIRIEAVDMNGNVSEELFFLFSETLQPLLKISGDNQIGLPNTPCLPFVIEVRDVNSGRVWRGVSITFTVTAGDGTLSTIHTTTDENGRAESRLTLGPNPGTTTVEVSATGMEGTVTFTAVAGAAVDAVYIPDAKLRAAVEIKLGKAKGDSITSAEMATLIGLTPPSRPHEISDLTGLEFATNLMWLNLGAHSISDISPVAGLTNLTKLVLFVNSITDISAVAGLTNLIELQLGGNSITDISAVAGLTNLTGLWLQDNDISDISPVAGLTNLTRLVLSNNSISDISPLVVNTGLGRGDTVDVRGNPLSHLSIHTHIPTLQNRGVTVEFGNRTHLAPLKISGDNQSGVSGTVLTNPFVVEIRDKNLSVLEGISVTFTVTAGDGTLSVTRTTTDESGRAESTLTLGPKQGTTTVEVSATGMEGTVTFTAIAEAALDLPDPNLRAKIEEVLGKAPGATITPSDMAKLTHLEARNANISDLTGLEYATNLTSLFLSAEIVGNEWQNSNVVSDLSPLSGLANLTRLTINFDAITDISPLAGLTSLTGLFLWDNNITDISAVAGLTNLTELSLGANNITDISPLSGLTNLTGLWLNGNNITDILALVGLTNLTILWFSSNNISDISPLIANTGLGSGDTVYVRGNPLSYQSIHTHIPTLQSRGVTVEFDNRAHPALLKISGDNQNGAAFAPLSQPFVVEAQDANGAALAGISVRFAVTAGGGTLNTTITRTNPNGRAQSTLTLGPNLGTNTVEVSATGVRGKAIFHAISDTESPPIIADVNGDGSVNVLDLIVITSNLDAKGSNLAADVNRDGIVNILDLVLAAGMFDGAAAAPSTQLQVPETLTAVEVQGWLTYARSLEAKDLTIKRGMMVLEQLLIYLTPKETELLANYPNPFNPETWIPYRLAEDAFVTLTIYDGSGRVVRTLDVGHRIASAYENRSKAIHWDGRNDVGEPVASSVYFYTLTAGNYSATRRMVILK